MCCNHPAGRFSLIVWEMGDNSIKQRLNFIFRIFETESLQHVTNHKTEQSIMNSFVNK